MVEKSMVEKSEAKKSLALSYKPIRDSHGDIWSLNDGLFSVGIARQFTANLQISVVAHGAIG